MGILEQDYDQQQHHDAAKDLHRSGKLHPFESPENAIEYSNDVVTERYQRKYKYRANDGLIVPLIIQKNPDKKGNSCHEAYLDDDQSSCVPGGSRQISRNIFS